MLAVVTGAGSGMGRACVRLLGERGLSVVCVGRRLERLEESVLMAEKMGASGLAVAADVGTADGVRAVREAVGDEEVAALVHAAGRESLVPFTETDREEFEAVMETNLAGPFFLTQALAPTLTKGAGVVFVASVAALSGRERHTAYAASKAALIGLTKNLAAELAPGVRVNCVCPGATMTPMLGQFLAEYVDKQNSEEAQRTMTMEKTRVMLGRTARPAEVASTIVHLALDATAVTGITLPVDGGYTAR